MADYASLIAEDLPFIDAHAVDVAAPPDDTWGALVRTTGGAFGGGSKSAFAGLLGCEQTERSGELGAVSSTIVGFRVAESVSPRRLALEGRHRFSRYRLAFEIEASPSGSRLTAITHAEFPGLHGRAYRALVIGTRGHVLATTRLLRGVKRRAEQSSNQGLKTADSGIQSL